MKRSKVSFWAASVVEGLPSKCQALGLVSDGERKENTYRQTQRVLRCSLQRNSNHTHLCSFAVIQRLRRVCVCAHVCTALPSDIIRLPPQSHPSHMELLRASLQAGRCCRSIPGPRTCWARALPQRLASSLLSRLLLFSSPRTVMHLNVIIIYFPLMK